MSLESLHLRTLFFLCVHGYMYYNFMTALGSLGELQTLLMLMTTSQFPSRNNLHRKDEKLARRKQIFITSGVKETSIWIAHL